MKKTTWLLLVLFLFPCFSFSQSSVESLVQEAADHLQGRAIRKLFRIDRSGHAKNLSNADGTPGK
jgi:hypothetical protein